MVYRKAVVRLSGPLNPQGFRINRLPSCPGQTVFRGMDRISASLRLVVHHEKSCLHSLPAISAPKIVVGFKHFLLPRGKRRQLQAYPISHLRGEMAKVLPKRHGVASEEAALCEIGSHQHHQNNPQSKLRVQIEASRTAECLPHAKTDEIPARASSASKNSTMPDSV